MAEKLNLSVHTIRYYDNQNLIPGLKRNRNNQRIFDEEQLEWIMIVRCLRKTGLSIKEVRCFVDLFQKGDTTLFQRKEILTDQKEKIEREIEKLEKSKRFLELKIEHYDLRINGDSDDAYHKRFADFIEENAY